MVNVSVVVPMRNEEPYIGVCLRSLLCQTYPSEGYEVIVVDGRSSDCSGEIVRDLQAQWPNLRLLDNPAGIVPTGMNIGIRSAQGEMLIRADAHNIYPPDYIQNCVKYLEETGAANVGGPWETVPADDSFGARLVAAVLRNPFGVGNSQYRIGKKEGFVDTVPFGAFRKEIFSRVGMFDEKLVRNQDNDLNARIRTAGGRIYLTPALTTQYYPAKRFRDLLGKTFRECRWHVFTLRRNRYGLGLRHLTPAAFVLFLVITGGLSFSRRWALMACVSVLAVYLIMAFGFALRAARTHGALVALAMPFSFLCFHIAYGLGALLGLKYLFKDPIPKPIRPGRQVRL